MKIKTVVTLIFITVSLLGIVGAMYRAKPVRILPDKLFGWKIPISELPASKTAQNSSAHSNIRSPGGIAKGLPVRLQIPVIGVDTEIEDAVVTPDGRMDVPEGSVNVAWFALGPHPGEEGSAVIGGHFGIEKGVPFVFYNLNKVKVGDIAYIINDKNETITFQVRAIKSFDRNADPTTVFTSTDKLHHLNIITCEGVWNQINGNYPQRLVVFTDQILTLPATPQPVTEVSTPSPTTKSLYKRIVEWLNTIL